MMLFIGSLLMILAVLEASEAQPGPPLVDICNGTYAGTYSPAFNQDIFLGMPFAKPPTGCRRLRVPESLDTAWTGIREAVALGDSCPAYQTPPLVFDSLVFGEDCLTINVARPAGVPSSLKLPVAVWIYGGGFASGSSAWPVYNLSWIVNASQEINKPLIAVSFNYRLGVLGFLPGSELAAEGNINLGLLDQRLALQWVHENIAAFGGDPAKVTIFGESAGAMSVGVHMIAYGGRDDGLFRAGVLESGGLSSFPWDVPTSNASNTVFDSVVSTLGCSDHPNKLQCLRALPYEDIYNAFNPANNATPAPSLFPTIDGSLIRENPIESLLAGRYLPVPTIIGNNDDEGSLFAVYPPGSLPDTDEELANILAVSYPFFSSDDIERILQLYPNIPSLGVPYGRFGDMVWPSLGLQWRRAASIVGDITIIAPARWMSEILSNTSAVYKYRFNVTNPLAGFPDYDGSAHGDEVNYVWNWPDLRAYSPESSKVVDVMAKTWVSFFVDLTPNNHGLEDVPIWEPYSSNTEGENFVIEIDSIDMEVDNFRKEGIDLINKVKVTTSM